MKLNDKKSKKAVSFDARGILERNSENMEKITVGIEIEKTGGLGDHQDQGKEG